MKYQEILSQVKSGEFAPVYYLHGEEDYFTDKLVGLLEQNVLSESEVAFNKEVFYGSETQLARVLNACQSFPVMATRRLVIVKEAQQVNKKEWDRLGIYLQQPVSSTVLVIAFKGKNNGLSKALTKKMASSCVDFFAKKLYERDVQQWIESQLQERSLQYDPGIPMILTTNLGINLGLIENELNKIWIYLQATQQHTLTKEMVFSMINVDKDFNVFELIHALSLKDVYRSHLIIDRLTQNTKLNPAVLTISNLFRFYHNLAIVHTQNLREPNSIKHQLQVNYFAAKDYAQARQHYPLTKVYQNIRSVQEADQLLKGIVSTQMDDRHILKTLVYQLL